MSQETLLTASPGESQGRSFASTYSNEDEKEEQEDRELLPSNHGKSLLRKVKMELAATKSRLLSAVVAGGGGGIVGIFRAHSDAPESCTTGEDSQ